MAQEEFERSLRYLTNRETTLPKWARRLTPAEASEMLARLDDALARAQAKQPLDTDEVILSDMWRRPTWLKIIEHGDVQVVGALLVEQLGAQTKKEAMRKSALAIKTYYAQK